MLCISANLKNIISVTEINVAITVPTPVFTPIRLRTNKNTSSVVVGIVNSDIEKFDWICKFQYAKYCINGKKC